MIRVIAYTYLSDVHCPACTRNDAYGHYLVVNNQHPHAFNPAATGSGDGNDENGINYNLQDRDGNLIHPVLSTDKHGFTRCSDCNEEL